MLAEISRILVGLVDATVSLLVRPWDGEANFINRAPRCLGTRGSLGRDLLAGETS
jgi:hypothetical protein